MRCRSLSGKASVSSRSGEFVVLGISNLVKLGIVKGKKASLLLDTAAAEHGPAQGLGLVGAVLLGPCPERSLRRLFPKSWILHCVDVCSAARQHRRSCRRVRAKVPVQISLDPFGLLKAFPLAAAAPVPATACSFRWRQRYFAAVFLR